ncbi:MAG: hypothetical protein IJ038_06920 [Clostridia bacterium]|nr:hypothetical protein [Clostridia bacterium]
MGFGLLFIGYFITYIMALNSIGPVFRLVGYAIMCRATGKLSEYDGKFKFAQIGSIVLIVFSAVDSIVEAVAFLHENLILESNPVENLPIEIILDFESVVVFVYHVLLLLAIRSIAKETDVHKITVSVGSDFFFIGLYYLLSIIGYIPFPFQESYVQNMGLPLVILYLVWIIFDLKLIFSCYVYICDEQDVDMERKPSRFAFVNKFRAAFEQKQQRAKEESDKYKREKAEARRNRKNGKK